MSYRINATGDEVSLAQLRSMFPNVGFAQSPTSDFLASLGVDEVLATAPPQTAQFVDPIRDGLEQGEDGKWRQKWGTVPWPQDRINLFQAQQRTQQRNAILAQILDIETNRQPRAIRDAVMRGNSSYLNAVDSEIAALRAQLQALADPPAGGAGTTSMAP